MTVRSRTWVEDNVTGVECDDTTEVPILIGDFEVTANLTAESRDALVALLRDDRDPEPLCKLLGVVLVETVEAEPAERRRRSSSPKPKSDGENALARAWAVENGLEVNPRGRVSKDIIERYRAAQAA